MSHDPVPIESSLIDATEATIAEYGIARTSLERIGERAGLSRATVYRRGVTVEALVAAVIDRAMASFRAALWESITGLDTAAVRLRAAAGAILDATEQHLPVLVSMFAPPASSGHGPSAPGASGPGASGPGASGPGASGLLHAPGPDGLTLDIFAAPFERILADGALDGSLRPVPPQVTATVLLSTMVWGYVHLRHCHDWPVETTRQSVIDLALRGVVPDVETAPTATPAPTEREPS